MLLIGLFVSKIRMWSNLAVYFLLAPDYYYFLFVTVSAGL